MGNVTLPPAAPLPLPWLASVGYLLDPRALSDVGLFRVPGSKKEVDDLLAALQPNANPRVDALKGCFDPNAVASLIKRLMVDSTPRQPLTEEQVRFAIVLNCVCSNPTYSCCTSIVV